MNSDNGHRRVRPSLETLESRLNMDAAGFVQSLYIEVLGRTGSDAEVASHVQSMNNGASAEAIAQLFWTCEEHRGNQVDAYYQHYLRRNSDTGGRSMFVQQFLAGASEDDIERQFLTSVEYGNAHTSDALFLEGLYQDVLGRLSDSAGRDFWLNQPGATRDTVANSFLKSAEANEDEVDAFFNGALNRDADSQGAAFWTAALSAGASTTALAVGFYASPEYIQLTASASATPTPSLAEQATFRDSSNPELNRANLLTGTTRAAVVGGLPLTLTLNVNKVLSGLGVPLGGARVDLWQADVFGSYSDDAASGTSGEAYLRGYLFTDANGSVTFNTIVPGAFSGRTSHINFKVRTFTSTGAVASEFTSQLFFPDAFVASVYSNAPYLASGAYNTTNATDGIFNSPTTNGPAGNQLLLNPVSSGGGFAATYTVNVS